MCFEWIDNQLESSFGFRLILITVTMKIIHLQQKREAYRNYSMVLREVIQGAFNTGQVDAARMMAFVPGTEKATEVTQDCYPHFVEGSAVLVIGTYNPMYQGNGDPLEKNGDNFSNASVQSFFKSVPASAGLEFEQLRFDFFDLVPFIVPIVNPWNPDGRKIAHSKRTTSEIGDSLSLSFKKGPLKTLRGPSNRGASKLVIIGGINRTQKPIPAGAPQGHSWPRPNAGSVP